MTIKTRSKFYYDFEVKESAFQIPFDEGAGELIADMFLLKFTPSQLAVEIARAMTSIGTNDYICSFNRTTRVYEITSLGGTFSILGASNTAVNPAVEFLGFELIDSPFDTVQTGISAVGKVFSPQFLLQSYVSFEDYEQTASGTVKITATGGVEVVTFGQESFMEFDIKYSTDIEQPKISPIENNPNGVSDLREFLRYAITKGNFEIMPDRDDVNVFFEVLLEKTATSKDGLGFKLKELYNKNLIGYFDTGKITLRKI